MRKGVERDGVARRSVLPSKSAIILMPLHENPSAVLRSREPALAVVRAGVTVAALSALAYAAFGGGFVNTDAMWTLVWGREAINGSWPDYAAGPTPHPLTNLVGVLLAPLGSAAEPVLHVLGFSALGAFVYTAGLVAYRLFGPIAALATVALLLTRDVILFYGSLAYLDVPYAALVLGATAMVVRERRRGRAVLVLLLLAGLLRPEAWILSGGYWLYLMVDGRQRGDCSRSSSPRRCCGFSPT